MNDPFNKMGGEHADRVAYLVAGYIRHTLSEEEHDELDEWITASDENQRLFEELTDPVTIQRGLNEMARINVDGARDRIANKIKFTDKVIEKPRKRWISYTAAASIILAIGLVIFFMTNKKTKTGKEIIVKTNEIKPGGNYAMLTLPDGRTINLYDAKKGLIDSTRGNEVLKSADGQINYIGDASSNSYHVLTTPAGGQYSVLLPDSTRVWLNSSSSLKYPVAFDKKERVVELIGEGYFEVRQHLTPNPSPLGEGDRKIPFIVKAGDVSVEVMGTDFNINSYSDEPGISTTLVKGRVKVVSNKLSVTHELHPGDKAFVDKRGQVDIVHGVSVEEFIAWKDGKFQFKDASIEEVMRQVGRWYNTEIVYEGKIDQHFNATIYRNEPVEKLLHFLEETNEVHFKVEGKRIVVSK